jgi:putative transposase
VSRICPDLDVEVAAFRDRSLAEQPFRYVFIDATYCKARDEHRVVSQAVVLGIRIGGDGRCSARLRRPRGRRVLDALLRSLKTRGLGGVQLAITRGPLPSTPDEQAMPGSFCAAHGRLHQL